MSDNLIRVREVMALTGLSRTTIWRRVKVGDFPAPVETTPDTIAWYRSEVETWMAKRPRRTYRVAGGADAAA